MKKCTISFLIILILGILIIVSGKILSVYDWYLRDNIILISEVLIFIGVFGLGILSLMTIKSKGAKTFFIVTWCIIGLIAGLIITFITAIALDLTEVAKIDGTDYLGVHYVSFRNRLDIDYYKEYNIFAYHKSNRYIEEFYDNVGDEYPAFRTYYENGPLERKVIYFDENGKQTNVKYFDKEGKEYQLEVENQ